MKTVCKYLGYCVAVLGAIGSIGMAYVLGVTVSEGYWSTNIVRSWPLTILYFVAGAFATAVGASILLGISEILEYLEAIKRISLETSGESDRDALANLAKIEAATFWKCPSCGKNNPPHTGTCSCGQDKP